MTIFKANSYIRLYEGAFTGTLWSMSPEAKVVFITMIWMATGGDGTVSATATGIARLAHVSVEACEKALSELEAPEKDSRSQEHEGRRIKKVDGGWFIFNYQKYQESSKGATRHSSHSTIASVPIALHSMKENENENERTLTGTSQRTARNSVRTSNGTSNGENEVVSGLSEAEARSLESYSEGFERRAFFAVRDWAERAAKEGKPSFPLAQRALAGELGYSQRYISGVIKKMRRLGHIKQTKSQVVGKLAAEYRWALETTLPIPAYSGMDIEEDDPF